MPPRTVRLYPELAIAALKTKQHKQLHLWHCLRRINSSGSSIPEAQWGSGHLDLELAMEALVNSFGYSFATAYRHLNMGEGHFWDRYTPNGHTRIKIKSLKAVSEYLGTYPGRRVLEVPASQFQTTRQRSYWLFASFHQVDGNRRARPISRASIEEATGIQRRTQQRYDKLAKTKRVATFAVERDHQGNLVPLFHAVEGKSRLYRKHRRLGNIYHCQASEAAPGMTRKTRRELRQSLIRGEARSNIPKRFYLSARAIARRIKRDTETLLLVRPMERVVPGRVEWEIV